MTLFWISWVRIFVTIYYMMQPNFKSDADDWSTHDSKNADRSDKAKDGEVECEAL